MSDINTCYFCKKPGAKYVCTEEWREVPTHKNCRNGHTLSEHLKKVGTDEMSGETDTTKCQQCGKSLTSHKYDGWYCDDCPAPWIDVLLRAAMREGFGSRTSAHHLATFSKAIEAELEKRRATPPGYEMVPEGTVASIKEHVGEAYKIAVVKGMALSHIINGAATADKEAFTFANQKHDWGRISRSMRQALDALALTGPTQNDKET